MRVMFNADIPVCGSPDGGTRRRFLVVHNPTAGRRRERHLRAILDVLRQGHQASVTVFETTAKGDAARRVGALRANEADALVVAGGDGTINEAINGLFASDGAPGAWLDAGRPLGVAPMGTANVLAAELGLPSDAQALANHLALTPARRIHLGTANGRAFSMMVGVGLDAHVVAGVDPKLKRLTGKGAYVAETLTQLVVNCRARFQVTIDGMTREVAAAVVANGHYYGGTFVCAAEARLDDPRLHVCLFPSRGKAHALRYTWGVVAGRLGHFPDYEVIPARHVVIEGPDGEWAQGDGDIIGRVPLDIQVARHTVPVIA